MNEMEEHNHMVESSCSYIAGKTYENTIFFWCWRNDFITEEGSATKTYISFNFQPKRNGTNYQFFRWTNLCHFFFLLCFFASWKRFSGHKRNRERKKILREKPLTHLWMHKYLVKINMSVDTHTFRIFHMQYAIFLLVVSLGYSIKHVFWIY